MLVSSWITFVKWWEIVSAHNEWGRMWDEYRDEYGDEYGVELGRMLGPIWGQFHSSYIFSSVAFDDVGSKSSDLCLIWPNKGFFSRGQLPLSFSKLIIGLATYFLTICSKLGRYMVQWYNTTQLPGYNTQLLILHKNPIVSWFQETGCRELTAKPKLALL